MCFMRVGSSRGRASLSNPVGRFESLGRVDFLEDLSGADEDFIGPSARTATVTAEKSRGILTRNQSPDIPFEQSINPYRGCEHGCIYCYARPSHAYMGLSPGLDFETNLFVKENAAGLLRKELSRSGYKPRIIALGANTDPYQPVERTWRVTREILEVLQEFRHPVAIITKSALVTRDLDILSEMARDNLVGVNVSVTTLDSDLSRKLEPRASSPERRLSTLEALSAEGVPTGVMVAPVIPALTDLYLETILERSHDAGARQAGYVMLRLPHEVKNLFREWLRENVPTKADHVMTLIRDIRAGKDYVARWGERLRGTGKHADLLAHRFKLAVGRLGFNETPWQADFSEFRVPGRQEQMSLF